MPKNVVLVHGGFVDGSGWEGVYDALRKDGFTVSIVQNPTISLADDVAVWKTQPSWYLVATEDKMIPPPAQRLMAEGAGAKVAEAAGSHSIYISQPHAVAALIVQAAKGLKAATS
jgi:hypothetical protein